jgi:circadian clock protein KaiC
MVIGPTGVGKSTMGYRFLATSSADERGLLFSFYETPKGALSKAQAIGLQLRELCEQGNVQLIWHSPVEKTLDAIGGTLLEAIDRHSVKRLFLDGFNALRQAATYPERVPQFFAALGRELRARGVTTVYSAELPQIYAPQIEAPLGGVSPLLENLFLLRFVEVRSQIHRVISVLKLRDSAFDPKIREFMITAQGLEVGDDFPGEEAILTGVAHKRPRGRQSVVPVINNRKGRKAKSTRRREARRR